MLAVLGIWVGLCTIAASPGTIPRALTVTSSIAGSISCTISHTWPVLSQPQHLLSVAAGKIHTDQQQLVSLDLQN